MTFVLEMKNGGCEINPQLPFLPCLISASFS